MQALKNLIYIAEWRHFDCVGDSSKRTSIYNHIILNALAII